MYFFISYTFCTSPHFTGSVCICFSQFCCTSLDYDHMWLKHVVNKEEKWKKLFLLHVWDCYYMNYRRTQTRYSPVQKLIPKYNSILLKPISSFLFGWITVQNCFFLHTVVWGIVQYHYRNSVCLKFMCSYTKTSRACLFWRVSHFVVSCSSSLGNDDLSSCACERRSG
jgi:hypothetical protein